VQSADAADITQGVLLRLVRRMGEFRYDEGGSFRAYLKTLVRYAWCDFLEQRRDPAVAARAGLDDLAGVAAREDLERRLEEEFDRELLAEAMTRVARLVQAQTWEAFRLQAIEGMAAEQVAERLNMNIASVYKARSNVSRRLKETIRVLEAEVPGQEGGDV
jgi:RNA polymerase sigma-70 factor (ECF subfamily)